MTDILLGIDENAADIDDLLIANGDLVIGESTLQHQRHLLIAEKGEYKENPTVGVGIYGFLLDDNVEDMMRTVVQEFSKDGMLVDSVKLNNDGKLAIDAEYQ